MHKWLSMSLWYLSSFFDYYTKEDKITEARAVHNRVLQMDFTPAPPSQPLTAAPPSQPSARNDSTVLDNNNSSQEWWCRYQWSQLKYKYPWSNSHADGTDGPESPNSYKVHRQKKLRWLSADEISIPDSIQSNYLPSHLLLPAHFVFGMNVKSNHFLMSWIH